MRCCGSRRAIVVMLVLVLFGKVPAMQESGNNDNAVVSRPEYVDVVREGHIQDFSGTLDKLKNDFGIETYLVWNVNSRTPHRIVTSGIKLASGLSESEIISVSDKFIGDYQEIFGVGLADLRLQSAGFHGKMWYVNYQRYYRGLPVINARAAFVYHANGNLVSIGADTYPSIDINTSPTLSETDAVNLASQYAGSQSEDDEVLGTELLVLPLELENEFSVHLAWQVIIYCPELPSRWFICVDANSGELLTRWDGIMYEFSGNVNGNIQLTDPFDDFVNMPFKDLTVTAGSNGSDETDENGNYSISGSGAANVTAQLRGPYLDVNRYDGGDGSFSGSSSGVLNINWTSISQPQERDAYYQGIIVHDYIRNLDPGFTGMDFQLPCNVNVSGSCNAYWNGSSINFYAAGGSCPNIAQMPTVVHHEYGHGITEKFYYPVNLPYSYETGGLNEGWSDFIANCITDQALMGRGWSGPGTYLRSSDNNAQYPGSGCGGEPHCMGDIMVGALWDMRVNLIATHGLGVKTYVDSLWHFSRYAKPITYLDYLWELMLYDDDDGDPLNGTPNFVDICDAFGQHNMDCPELALLSFDYPYGLPEFVNPSGGNVIRMTVTGVSDLPVPNSGMLHYDAGDGYVNLSMNMISNNVYEIALPAIDCGTGISYYFSVQAYGGGVVNDPIGAPGQTYSSTAAYDIISYFDDNFETNQGWTVVNSSGLAGGTWQRGIPAGGGDRGDPPTDYDGSSRCYLTENVDGNSDVDEGFTHLISPTLDLSSGNGVVSYALWYTNNSGSDPNNDLFKTYISSDNGVSWILVETIGPVSYSGWEEHAFVAGNYVTPTATVKLRFEASDFGAGSIVEAGIDAVSVFVPDCDGGGCVYITGDVNGSGNFNGLDITFGVSYFKGGSVPVYECDCPNYGIWYAAGDVNGSCSYNGLDITYGVSYLKGGEALVPCPDCPPASGISKASPGIGKLSP